MIENRGRRISRVSAALLAFCFGAYAASRAQCTLPAASGVPALIYSLEPVIADNNMALRVTLAFKAGPQGTVRLELPSEWAGQQHEEKAISQLKALDPRATITDTSSPARKDLHSQPNEIVRISYMLAKDWDGPLDSNTRFRPDLSPASFHITGVNALVHPEFDGDQLVDIHFDWQKLPPGWSLASSFGTDERCQSFHGPWRNAVNSLFVGGDYRIYRTQLSGNALDFAIRGTWRFSDDQWVNQVRRIIGFEREFWHDEDFPYFLVTLTPFDQEGGSTGGTALTNAFMMHLSRLDPIRTDALGVLAHETFHGWNPGKLGHPQGSDYPVSWFFEGFTAYYQNVMLYRAGVTSFPDYLDAANRKIREYELREGTNVSLEGFVRRHSADKSVLDQLDHRRGAVLGMWLDATIRQKTGGRTSLDDLMFDMVAEESAYQRKHNGKPLPLTNRRIFRAVSKYAGRKFTRELRSYVEQGGSVPVPEAALGPCAQSHIEDLVKFDAGFDAVSLKKGNKIVSGVEPDSEAYKAGLRDSQELVAWSITNGDPTKEIRLKVKASDGERLVEYYPQGGKVSVQQFRLDSARYSSDPQLCSAAAQATPAR